MGSNEAFKASYRFLYSRPEDEPFVLMINFNVPHALGNESMQQRDSDLDLYKAVYRDKLSEVTVPETCLPIKTSKRQNCR
jgi:hypothetical protein